MFDKIKQMGELMKMAGQAKERMAELQAELEKKQVEGESGGGAVRVVLNGKGRVLKLELDKLLLLGIAGDDKEMVEDLIVAAVNQGMERVQELMGEQMRELTGGIDLPGLEGMIGGNGSG